MKRRIALFADVHANLPALQAVIGDSLSRSIDEYWNLGDMVGYAPYPNEAVALLRRQCSRHVTGNHDIKCADSMHAAKMRSDGKDADKVFSFEWTHCALTAENKAFIAGIPRTELVAVAGVKILMTHGSPQGMNDCLTPRTPAARLTAIAAEVAGQGVEVVLCGHTHEFFDRKVEGVRFVNPGGVGRSFDGDCRASYCILEVNDKHHPAGEGGGNVGRVKVEHVRVAYPQDALLVEMRARAFPERLVRSSQEARSFEDLNGLKTLDAERCLFTAAELGRQYPHEGHARHVALLAAEIFEGLKVLHGLGMREGVYLRVAAFLHDIGWAYGKEGHHKASRDMILKDHTLLLDGRERVWVALIARYHRGSLPEDTHKIFQDLASYAQETVSVLAACLRIADGLDRSHCSVVERVKVSVGEKRITFSVLPRKNGEVAEELLAARNKSDLLENIFGRTVVFRCGVV